ncbi:MAG TPA: ATP-binding protein [Nocardioidaceae bacterium]|nr:ATP-binding protein [Nocardioidaceae bacterium]
MGALTDLVDQLAAAVQRRAQAGVLTDAETGRLSTAVELVAARCTEQRDAVVSRALAGVAEVFVLEPLEERLLLAAALPDLDTNAALALTTLDGGEGVRRPSVGLLLELSGADPMAPAHRATLAPHGALRRQGLIHVDGDGPALTRPVRCPDLLVERLLGFEGLSARMRAASETVLPRDLDAGKDLLRALQLGTRLCWVHSPLGAAGASLAAGAFEQAGVAWDAVDVRRLASDPLSEALPEVLLEAGLRRRGLVLVSAEALVPDEPGADTRAVALLNDSAVPVIAVSRRPWDPRWSTLTPLRLEAPRLTPSQRHEVWCDVVAELVDDSTATALPDDPDWPDLLSLRLTPEEVVAATRAGRLAADVAGRPVDAATLRSAVRQLSTAAVVEAQTPTTLDDLVLPAKVMGPINQIIAWARSRDEVAAMGAVHGVGGKGNGISALFAGGPGTGKTLAAHVVADTLGLDLMPVDLSSVVDKYVGETERNLERIFHDAENLNVVLFFDEADSLFGNRSAVNDSRDRYANLEVSYLLQRMEKFNGIVILATNLRGNLDPAFSRRLQFIVHFADPDAATRERLWAKHLSRVGGTDPQDPVDCALLAEHLQVAGGDIRNIVLTAAFESTTARQTLGMRHLLVAAARECEKLGRRLPPAIQAAQAAMSENSAATRV